MDERVENSLLQNVPVGEELHDPREGTHELTLGEVKHVVSKEKGTNGFEIKFTGGKDSEGHSFDFTHTAWAPVQESSDGFKRMFLAFLHDIGLVDRSDHRQRFITGQEDADAYVAALKGLQGTMYPIRLDPDKTDGRLQLKFIRRR